MCLPDVFSFWKGLETHSSLLYNSYFWMVLVQYALYWIPANIKKRSCLLCIYKSSSHLYQEVLNSSYAWRHSTLLMRFKSSWPQSLIFFTGQKFWRKTWSNTIFWREQNIFFPSILHAGKVPKLYQLAGWT